MNGLLIVVGIIFVVCMVVGYMRGFIKIVASLAATLATIVLVAFLTPYVSGILLKTFPIEAKVQKKCVEFLMPDAAGSGALALPESVENSRESQIALIENAKLPDMLKQLLLENNNDEIYKALGINTFSEYVGSYLAKMVADILAFLLTMLIVTIIVRIVLGTLGIIGKLPLIGGLNRAAGAALGIVTGLLIVWVLFIAITLLYDTEIGRTCFANIAENKFLTSLYDNNILLNYITKFRG